MGPVFSGVGGSFGSDFGAVAGEDAPEVVVEDSVVVLELQPRMKLKRFFRKPLFSSDFVDDCFPASELSSSSEIAETDDDERARTLMVCDPSVGRNDGLIPSLKVNNGDGGCVTSLRSMISRLPGAG